MKTAIFGGSFNPVHLGHIALAEYVHRRDFDRILFIPARFPPHKALSGGAGDSDRIGMLELALSRYAWAALWRGEFEREGPSYSIDTVDELIAANIVEPAPGFIIGEDLAADFSSWKEPERLSKITQILLARRTEAEAPAEAEYPPPFFPYPHRRLENPLFPYSSSQVRRIIIEGRGAESLLPPGVAEYISDRGIYRTSDG